MAQARDWRGRWTSGGGGGFRPSNSRAVRVRGGTARVTRLKNGKPTRPSRWGSHAATGGTVGRLVKSRPGAPVGNNKNVRYMSRTHRGFRGARIAVGGPLSIPGPAVGAARYHSRRVASKTTIPKGGYIISYGPKG